MFVKNINKGIELLESIDVTDSYALLAKLYLKGEIYVSSDMKIGSINKNYDKGLYYLSLLKHTDETFFTEIYESEYDVIINSHYYPKSFCDIKSDTQEQILNFYLSCNDDIPIELQDQIIKQLIIITK